MKRYKKVEFNCRNYEDMIATYNQMYADHYQLIGYRIYQSAEMSQKAILTFYPKKGAKENGNKKRV